jgi:hypothetical protein
MYARRAGRHDRLLARQYDVDDRDGVEEPGPENDYGERRAKEAAARYYAEYHGWRAFAREVYDVSLGTFLRVPFPERDLTAIEETAGRVDGSDMSDPPAPEDMTEECRAGIERDREVTPDVAFGGWARGVTIQYHGAERAPGEAAAVKAGKLADAYADGGIEGRSRRLDEQGSGGDADA